MLLDDCLKRDKVDKLRRIYWYEGIRISMRAPSAYFLEREFDLDGFGKNQNGAPYHRNKWNKYRRGLHTPSDELVEKVNTRVRGSRGELNHVLWAVLAGGSIKADEWLRQLSPKLQMIVFHDEHILIRGGRHYLGKLERRASIDALACLTILLQLCVRNKDYEAAWDFARTTFRVLLMLGSHFSSRGIADAIFEFYAEHIFHDVAWKGCRFNLETYSYSQCAKILDVYSRTCERKKTGRMEWHEQVSQMSRILRGDFGLDLMFGLAPPVGPDLSIGPPTEDSLKEHCHNIRLRDWGLTNARSFGSDRFPPDEVWNR